MTTYKSEAWHTLPGLRPYDAGVGARKGSRMLRGHVGGGLRSKAACNVVARIAACDHGRCCPVCWASPPHPLTRLPLPALTCRYIAGVRLWMWRRGQPHFRAKVGRKVQPSSLHSWVACAAPYPPALCGRLRLS
jgi:hypothetical protein